MTGNSSGSAPPASQPNRVRAGWAAHPPAGAVELDDIDRHLLRELAKDARLPNNALAERVGIAPSTCLGRVRSLRERGVISGYHADVDQAALGRPLQAMIAVRLQAHARGRIRGFVAEVAGLPEVLNVFFLAGKDDFLLHVAAVSTGTLRDFVEVLVGQRRRVLHRDLADLRAHPGRRRRVTPRGAPGAPAGRARG